MQGLEESLRQGGEKVIRIEDRGVGRVMREEKLEPGTINAIYRRKCHNEAHYIVC